MSVVSRVLQSSRYDMAPSWVPVQRRKGTHGRHRGDGTVTTSFPTTPAPGQTVCLQTARAGPVVIGDGRGGEPSGTNVCHRGSKRAQHFGAEILGAQPVEPGATLDGDAQCEPGEPWGGTSRLRLCRHGRETGRARARSSSGPSPAVRDKSRTDTYDVFCIVKFHVHGSHQLLPQRPPAQTRSSLSSSCSASPNCPCLPGRLVCTHCSSPPSPSPTSRLSITPLFAPYRLQAIIYLHAAPRATHRTVLPSSQ